MSDGPLERARALVEKAARVVVLTGAGISAESGVPTFRGAGGLWRSHRPEELATPEAFERDPRLLWEWYAWRREIVAGCAPNEGHRTLARHALAREGAVTLVTQNVDGLHHRAAREAAERLDPAPAFPLELHGAIHRDRCSGCGRRTDAMPVDASGARTLPRCGSCGALLRPDVVWFGEALDESVLADAFEAAQGAELCLVVGTSAVVHPAASVPLATLRAGGRIVEINPAPTPLSEHADAALRGPAGDLLPLLLGG